MSKLTKLNNLTSSDFIWKTSDQRFLKINDVGTAHLFRTIKMKNIINEMEKRVSILNHVYLENIE